MREIPLSNGMSAIVDDGDYDKLRGYSWHAQRGARTWYARNSRGEYMHRVLMGFPPKPLEVHHDNHNGLDNQRHNLMVATKGQNASNMIKRTPITGFRGVARNHKRFAAKIRVGCKWRYIGTYDTPEEAARAYDHEAIKTKGKFAALNFPQPQNGT